MVPDSAAELGGQFRRLRVIWRRSWPFPVGVTWNAILAGPAPGGGGPRGVPRSHEIEDLEGSVHEAGCPSGGLGDVASPK